MNNYKNNNNLRNENIAGLREVNVNTLLEEVKEKGVGNRYSPEYTLSENIRLPLKGPILNNRKVAPGAPKKAFGTLPRFLQNSRKNRKSRRANRKNRKTRRNQR
jgi:hypothetical protein